MSAPWDDRDGLFRPRVDYLVARDREEMKVQLRAVLSDPETAGALANGRQRITERHTCAHRVDALMAIASSASSP